MAKGDRFLAYFEDEKKPVRPAPAKTATELTPYGKAVLTNQCKRMAETQEGARDDTLLRIGRLIGGFIGGGEIPYDEGFDQLREAALSTGLMEWEVDKLHSHLAFGMNDPLAPPNSWAPGKPLQLPTDPLEAMVSADQIDCAETEPLVVHVPNMLTAGYSILGGSPKAGKSWLVLDLALACAAGGLAMGTVSVEPRAVFYLALEDGQRRIQHRMRQLGHGAPKDLFILTELQPGHTGVATITAWLNLHREDKHPPLVIVDTLATIRPTMATNSTNAYDIDYEFGRSMKTAADTVPGAAILAVHHNRKGDATDFIHKLSGSVGVTAACDCILALSRDRGSETATLSVTGKDLTREDDYALKRDGALWVVDGADLNEAAAAAAEAKKIGSIGDRAGDVLALIEKRGQRNETTRAADIAGVVDVNQASSYLDRLFKSGRIQKLKRGVYFPAGMLFAAESLDV